MRVRSERLFSFLSSVQNEKETVCRFNVWYVVRSVHFWFLFALLFYYQLCLFFSTWQRKTTENYVFRYKFLENKKATGMETVFDLWQIGCVVCERVHYRGDKRYKGKPLNQLIYHYYGRVRFAKEMIFLRCMCLGYRDSGRRERKTANVICS